jgi:uncharacterized metal-binding protein YceD (DUF177 family)
MKDTMMINLADINESGKDFDFKKGTDQALDIQIESVVESLKDFDVHVKFTRAGDIYMAVGKFSLKKEDICSLCAEDLLQNINKTFTEYLVIQDSQQEGHAPHSGLNYESTQETYFIKSQDLDVFEFLREVIAGGVSLYPKCEDTVVCKKRQSELLEKMSEKAKGFSAFAALEQLKKKH